LEKWRKYVQASYFVSRKNMFYVFALQRPYYLFDRK